MRKDFSIVFCLLFAGLLTACGAEAVSAAPVPARLREEPLPGKAAALLTLDEGDELIDWCAGDLNGDGTDDMALIVERNEEDSAGERLGKICELLVFLGNKQGYTPGPSSQTFITRGAEAYPGAPLSSLSIEEGALHIYEPIRKCERAADFQWQGDGLVLTQFYWGEWYGNGTKEYFDLTNGTYSMYSAYFDNVNDNPLPPKLLFQAVLDLPASWRLEDAPPMMELYTILPDAAPPLPYLGGNWYRSDLDSSGVLQHTPDEMLDQGKEAYYPDMERVDIPWTEETRANFSAVAGYPVPGYYYADGETTLRYTYLEFRYSDGGFLFLTHHILFEDGETFDSYSSEDETGIIETY